MKRKLFRNALQTGVIWKHSLFLRLGLPSQPICLKNGAFKKRSSNRRNFSENAGVSFLSGRKTSQLKTEVLENDGVVIIKCNFTNCILLKHTFQMTSDFAFFNFSDCNTAFWQGLHLKWSNNNNWSVGLLCKEVTVLPVSLNGVGVHNSVVGFPRLSVVDQSHLIFLSLVGNVFLVLSVVSYIFRHLWLVG